ADNNVKTRTEANGAVTSYTYDPNTGYPLTQTNAQEAPLRTTYTYQFSLGGHVADLTDVRTAAGRRTHYAYYNDAAGNSTGNLHPVQDPKGTAQPPNGTGPTYITTFAYYDDGRVKSVTDANGHATTYGYYMPQFDPELVWDPTGLPTTVTDALFHTTRT